MRTSLLVALLACHATHPGGNDRTGSRFAGHDRDGDGIPDDRDQCPDDAEDFDGFEDADGCPDPDNDHDRIPDVADKCPNEPETYNGYEDEDGCPDKGCVIVRGTADCVFESVWFDRGSARLTTDAQLELVAASLALPDVQLVAVRGYHLADEPAALSADRARAVHDRLLVSGSDPQKLVIADRGVADHPRVDFEILRQRNTADDADDIACTAIGHVYIKLSPAEKRARCR
jgi:hypothetical protein